MRTVHALFVVSTLLFVTGVGLVIAGARAAQQAPAPAVSAEADLAPVATIKQLMTGIVVPASRTVFSSVGSIVTAAGIEERAPKSDAEWEEVATGAATLIESANLMMMKGRAVDRDGWAAYCRAMVEASSVVADAARKRDAQRVFDAAADIYDACNGCHQTYQR